MNFDILLPKGEGGVIVKTSNSLEQSLEQMNKVLLVLYNGLGPVPGHIP